MIMKLRFKWLLILLLMLLAAIFSGCAPQSTPPGADMFAGGIGQGGYVFLSWKEGLKVMFWHNGAKGSNCHGSSSTIDPVYRVECHAEFEDDRRIDWELQTVDGQSAQLWIDQASYDLAQGGLFIITAKTEETEIIQLQRDLSGLQRDHDSIINFAANDPDLNRFIETLSNTRTGIEDVDAIIDAILSGDIEARRALVHYTTSACTTADGLGGPPKCEPDEADGTMVKAFPVLGSEGHHVRPELIEDTLGFVVDDLYAVYHVPDEAYQAEYWPAGEYGLVFVRDEIDYLVTITVHVENGRMVRLDYDVGKPPAAIIEQKAGELLQPEGAGGKDYE
jgi:hypothetical protein